MNLRYPVESEEADILTKAIPGKRVPHRDVVVEALKFDVAFRGTAALVGVLDSRVSLPDEGIEQQSGD